MSKNYVKSFSSSYLIIPFTRSRSRQICWTRSIRSAEKEHVRHGGETLKTEKYATLQNQFKIGMPKYRVDRLDLRRPHLGLYTVHGDRVYARGDRGRRVVLIGLLYRQSM